MPEESIDDIARKLSDIFAEGEAIAANGGATIGDIVAEAAEAHIYGEPKRIEVPVIQGGRFSHNDRWARAVKAQVEKIDAKYREAHESDGTQIDRIWVVLMALPGALAAFDGTDPDKADEAS